MTAAHPDPLAWRRRLQERLRLPEKTVEMLLERPAERCSAPT